MKQSKTALFLIVGIVMALMTVSCTDQRNEVHFGEPFTDVPLVEVSEICQKADDFYRKVIRVRGVIERQCPSSGCWFFIRGEKGASLKVEMGDYFAKLPQNIGNEAIIEGEIIKKGEGLEFIGTRVSFFKKRTK